MEQIFCNSTAFTRLRFTRSKDWFMRGSDDTRSRVSLITAVIVSVPPSRSYSEPGTGFASIAMGVVPTGTPAAVASAAGAATHTLAPAVQNSARNAAAGRFRRNAMTEELVDVEWIRTVSSA